MVQLVSNCCKIIHHRITQKRIVRLIVGILYRYPLSPNNSKENCKQSLRVQPVNLAYEVVNNSKENCKINLHNHIVKLGQRLRITQKRIVSSSTLSCPDIGTVQGITQKRIVRILSTSPLINSFIENNSKENCKRVVQLVNDLGYFCDA